MIKNIDYHLIDRCNLNCAHCGHFCPLVPKDDKPKSIVRVKADLSTLFLALDGPDSLGQLTLTGGEITLNPDLAEIITFTDHLFRETNVNLKMWTNGLRYKDLINIADVIKATRFELCMSDYPVGDVQERVNKLTECFGDQFYYVTRRNNEDDNVYFFDSFFTSVRVASDQDIVNCVGRQECVQMVETKLYPCQFLAYLKYFNDEFPEDKIESSVDDFIDLRSVQSWDQVEQFINNYTSSICERCIDCVGPLKNEVPWEQSNKDKTEWIK